MAAAAMSRSAYLPREQTDPDAPLDYAKVLKFFMNPDTTCIHTRQLALLKKICRNNYDGYKVTSLPYIAQLLDHAHERAMEKQEFEEALCVLIELASKPYVRLKANHELYEEGKEALQAMVASLGRLLGSPLTRVKLSAVAALHRLTEGKDHIRTNDPREIRILGGVVREELRPLPIEYNNTLLHSVLETVAGELAREGKEYAEALLHEAAAAACRLEAIATMRMTRMTMRNQRHQQEEDEDEDEEDDGRDDIGSSYLPADDANPMSGNEEEEEEEEEEYDEFWDEDEIVLPGEEGGEEAYKRRQRQRASVLKRYTVLQLLRLVRVLALQEPNNKVLVRAGVVGSVVEILAVVPRVKAPLVSVGVDVLWNLLDASSSLLKGAPLADSRAKLVAKWRENNAVYRLGSERALWVLKDLLLRLLEAGYRSRDKELRNAVLVLLSFVSRNPHVHPHFLSTGLIDLLLGYATVAEMGQGGHGHKEDEDTNNMHPCLLLATADPHHHATVCPLDLELKRLLWGLLSNLLLLGQSANPDNVHTILHSPLLEVLLRYIKRLPNDAIPETGSRSACESIVERLPESHLAQTQLAALSALINLVPLAPEKFLALDGVGAVLTLLRSEPPINPQPDRVQRGLLLLQATASLPVLKDAYGEGGAVSLALHHFLSPDSRDDIKLVALRILAVVCEGHSANQAKFRREGGPHALVEALNVYTRKRAHVLANAHKDPLAARASVQLRRNGLSGPGVANAAGGGVYDDTPPPMPVCLVSTAWAAVIGNPKSESQFLDRGAMEALLDLLEHCPVGMRFQVVGLLSDLLRHPSSGAYAAAWRSDTNLAAAPQLLLSMWIREEDRLQVTRPGGVIENLCSPLAQHVCPRPPMSAAFAHLDDALSAASSTEIAQLPDLRPRLASTLHQLAAHEALWQTKIKPCESAAYAMAQNYETFRQAEVWREVESSLTLREVKPIAADALLLQAFVDHSYHTAQKVQALQRALQQQSAAEQEDEVNRVYQGILLQRDQELHQLRLKRRGLANKKRAGAKNPPTGPNDIDAATVDASKAPSLSGTHDHATLPSLMDAAHVLDGPLPLPLPGASLDGVTMSEDSSSDDAGPIPLDQRGSKDPHTWGRDLPPTTSPSLEPAESSQQTGPSSGGGEHAALGKQESSSSSGEGEDGLITVDPESINSPQTHDLLFGPSPSLM